MTKAKHAKEESRARDGERIFKTLSDLKCSYGKITNKIPLKEMDVLMGYADRGVLLLHGYKIGDQGSKKLVEALKNNTLINSFCLADNNIGEEGAKALGELLTHNQTITNLSLTENNITFRGGAHIAKGMLYNTTLKSLDLTGCFIGDLGAYCLAQVLNGNENLESLSLVHNNIGDLGIKLLAGALKLNTKLHSLFLSGNKFDIQGYAYLLDLMQNNCTIHTLDFYSFLKPQACSISQDFICMINQRVGYNKHIHINYLAFYINEKLPLLFEPKVLKTVKIFPLKIFDLYKKVDKKLLEIALGKNGDNTIKKVDNYLEKAQQVITKSLSSSVDKEAESFMSIVSDYVGFDIPIDGEFIANVLYMGSSSESSTESSKALLL